MDSDQRVTKVVNLHKEPYDVYIGRGSKWGNPFIIGRDGNRGEVIKKYQQYITVERHDLIEQLSELDGKTLGCFCKPYACHGDILVQLVKELCQQ